MPKQAGETGEVEQTEPAHAPTQVPSAAPSVPPGTVVISEEEHNRLQARARTAERKVAKMEEDEEARKAAEQAEAARAAGEFDEALRIEREAKAKLQAKLQERDISDAVRDQIAMLGFSGSKATGLQRLVNLKAIGVVDGSPDPDGVVAAVAATIEQYPDLFKVQAPPDDERETRMRRTPGPSAPPDATRDSRPADYISPQEYVSTPVAVRYTKEFRERVERSRPHWPTKIPATSFSVDQ